MRDLKTVLSFRKLVGMIGFAVIVSFGMQSETISSFFSELENRFIDYFFLLRGQAPKVSTEILVVYLDDDSLMDYGRLSPIPRKLLAKLILDISRKGAVVVGIDVILDEPGPEEDDRMLSEALAQVGSNIVLVADKNSLNGEDQQPLSLSHFTIHAAFGYSEIQADANDVVRSILIGSHNGVSSFTELIYEKYLSFTDRPVPQPTTEHQQRFIRINFSGSPDRPEDRHPKFLSIKASEVGQAADALFRNRIVLIGASNETTDGYYTPFSVPSNRFKKAFGIEIQAEAVNALLQQSWLTKTHWVLLVLMTFIAVLATMVSLFVIRPFTYLLVPLVLLLALPVLSAVLFVHEQVLFPVLKIETAILITLLIVQPVTYFKAVKRNIRMLAQRLRIEKSLSETQQVIRNLSSHQQRVIEDERTRIARELHDEMGQSLASIKLGLEYLNQEFGENHGRIEEATLEMITEVSHSLKSIKEIITDLRPKVLDDLGIGAAVDTLARDFQRKTGIRCGLVLKPNDPDIGQEISTDIFRMVQELLTNVVKHAEATRVRISIIQASRLAIQVSDNGRGISPAKIFKENSFGLLGIKERALKHNGRLRIRGIEGIGTTVRVVIS